MLCLSINQFHIGSILILIIIKISKLNASCGGSHSPYLVQDIDYRRILVKEDTLPGTSIIRFKCKDLDGDSCIFGIEPIDLPSNLIELKTLSANEAELILNDKLDRELKSSYSLSITVTDNVQDTSCKVKISAFIYVEDVNDEYPKFIDLTNPIDVYENSPVGTNVLNVTAIDLDTSYYGAVTFKLEPYEDENIQSVVSTAIFGLGASSSQGATSIQLLAGLDYEEKKVYRILLIARDGGGTLPEEETLATKVVLIINVKDVQDTGPRFIGLPYIFSIPENSPIGTPVFNALAQDGDTGAPNKILYSVVSSGKGLPVFAIDQKSGKVIVKGMLDRETVEDNGGAIFIKIRAEEDSLERVSVETTVTITLEDVNDMAPSFNKYRYYGKINENSPKLTSVIFYDENAPIHQNDNLIHESKSLEMMIKDADLGTNSAFKLTLEGSYGSQFTIDPMSAIKEISPVIRILDPKILDREKLNNITLKIRATEIYTNEKLWSEAEIIILIEDVNDEIPYFQFPDPKIPTYSAQVSEGANINDKIIRILAMDDDTSTSFSTISYNRLYGRGSDHFNLNPVSGWITLRIPLDRETKDSYSLNVEVTDNGNSRAESTVNRATCSVDIYVTDINDNAPQFTQPLYEALLLEGQLKFRQNLQVKAIDADQIGSPNSLVKYRFMVETPGDKEISSYFTVDEVNGTIKPKQNGPLLDYETIFPTFGNELKLKIEAFDSGIPTMSSFSQLLIHFEDANDNPPIFTKYYYSVSVPEDLNSSQVILNVSAFDGDLYSYYNSRLNYFIASQWPAQKFWLDPESGGLKLYPGANLDLDDGRTYDDLDPNPSYYLLNVSARDRGVPPLTSQNVIVNVTIYDVNDEMPRFDREIYRAYVSENSPDGTLLKISQNSATSAAHNYIHHSVNRGDNSNENVQDDFQYELIAWDPDKTSVVRYDIVGFPEILDENRDPLPNPLAGKNSLNPNILDYRSLFEIDPVTGRVYVKNGADLDREKVEICKIRIRARDINATLTQEAYATLIIKIMDVNDNSPYWIPSDTYQKSIFETITSDERIGEEILNLEAKDRDSNRSITYSIHGNSPTMLTLNSQTGVILQKDLIDFEKTQWINFTVTATDSGVPPRISFAKVFIKVLDRNDNTPKFTKLPQSPITLTENCVLGTEVGKVEAKDEDSGDFGKIHYMITDGSEGNFAIDKQTGLITVSGNIDREERALYRLLIVARDNWNNGLGTDFREISTRVEIRIADLNDNSPQFVTKSLLNNMERAKRKTLEGPPDVISLREDAKIGQVILHTKAIDIDQEGTSNSKISYKFSADYGNISDFFSVDSDTGMVKVSKSLLGLYGSYYFGVEAYDHGSPVLISQKADVFVFIEDYNDHAPDITYPKPDDKIFIFENQSYGHLILQMKARDIDRGKNGEIKYRLGDGFLDKKYFDIDSMTGNLTLRHLPNKAERKYHFQILLEAIDNGDPPLISSVPLNIYVVDMDNHKPIFNIENNIYKFPPLYENSSLGPLDKIPEAVDEDINEANRIICYFIKGGNINDTFVLHPMNRSLILVKPLDRERISSYTLLIESTNYCAKALSTNEHDHIKMSPEFKNKESLNDREYDFGNAIGRLVDKNYVTGMRSARNEVGLKSYFYKLKRQNNNSNSSDFEETFKDGAQSIESHTSFYTSASPYKKFRTQSRDIKSPSILRVIVNVLDVNDNPPVFLEKTFRTGVTTDAKIGTILHVPLEVEDKDLNSNHRFSIENVEAFLKGPSNYQLPFDPIAIDTQSGHVKTSMTFKPNLRGFINFSIVVTDLGTNFSDVASVTIYLLSPQQQILFVLSVPMLIFKVKQKQFIGTLENITGYMYNIDDMRVHVVDDIPNDEITDVVSHFIHPNGTVIDFNEIIRILDANQKHFAELKMEYDIEKIVRYVNLDSTLTLRKALFIYQIASYAAISGLMLMLVVFLLLWLPERAKYKKKLKAATALSISGKNGQIHDLNVPGTNVNSYASSNPMWTGNYYTDTNSKGHHILSEEHSKIASSEIWNNVSNPSLYSHGQATLTHREVQSQQGKESEKNEKLLSMINRDIANIQQRLLDEKSAALKSNCKGGQGSTGENHHYNTFGKKNPVALNINQDGRSILYQSPRPCNGTTKISYSERPLPTTPTLNNEIYGNRNTKDKSFTNGDLSPKPPLPPPRQELVDDHKRGGPKANVDSVIR